MSFFDEPLESAKGSRVGGGDACILQRVQDGKSLFPATNSTSVTNAKGIVTNITCTSYTDRHFVIITQTQKFGSLLTAWAEDRLDGLSKSYESHVLIGKRDDDLLNVFAKQIMQRIASQSNKPLLLSIALDEQGRDPETFNAVLDALFAVCSSW